MTEVDDKRTAISRSATASEIEPCLKKDHSHVHRAKAPRLCALDSVPAKKREQPSSLMGTGRWIRKVISEVEGKAGLGAGLKPSAKTENTIDATQVDSVSLSSKADSSYENSNLAVKAQCFIRSTAFNELEDQYDLETDCLLSGEVRVILADPEYSTCSGRR